MEELMSLNASNQVPESKLKKFDNLAPGEYLVKTFSLKKTVFGLRLCAEIDDFYLNLPPRYTDKVNSDEQLDDINSKQWKMVYSGKNRDQGNKLMIDFEPVIPDPQDSTNDDEDDDVEQFGPEQLRKSLKRKMGESSSKMLKKKAK